jgi:hypothetical protein
VHIFTTTPKFHGTTISNHYLEVIDCMDIAKGILSNLAMNKIMGLVVFDEDNDFPILYIAN